MEDNHGNNHHNDGGEVTGKKTVTAFPKTKLKRIMRHALQGHPQAKIGDDARDAVDRCTLEFADLITTVAAEECRKDSRKIVNGDDLISAMEILGFDHYVGPLDEYLRRYRESTGQPETPAAQVEMPPSGQPPATAVRTREPQAPSPQQPSGFVLGQQPPCDITELGLHTDVYAVWSRASEAGTSSLMPPARAD